MSCKLTSHSSVFALPFVIPSILVAHNISTLWEKPDFAYAKGFSTTLLHLHFASLVDNGTGLLTSILVLMSKIVIASTPNTFRANYNKLRWHSNLAPQVHFSNAIVPTCCTKRRLAPLQCMVSSLIIERVLQL